MSQLYDHLSGPGRLLPTKRICPMEMLQMSHPSLRSSNASSSHASLLQAIDGVMSLALCPQVVSQASQHFRSYEKQAAVHSMCAFLGTVAVLRSFGDRQKVSPVWLQACQWMTMIMSDRHLCFSICLFAPRSHVASLQLYGRRDVTHLMLLSHISTLFMTSMASFNALVAHLTLFMTSMTQTAGHGMTALTVVFSRLSNVDF